jgi:hypothetical protein
VLTPPLSWILQDMSIVPLAAAGLWDEGKSTMAIVALGVVSLVVLATPGVMGL